MQPDTSPAQLPATLASPVPVHLPVFQIARLEWRDHGQQFAAGPIRASLDAGASLRLRALQAQAHLAGQPWQLDGELQLAGQRPFALQGKLQLANPQLQLHSELSGSLQQLRMV